ncbi:unnamed protein product, partial [Effrenium voratum]
QAHPLELSSGQLAKRAWLLAKLRLRDPFLWHEVRLRARSCARQLTLHQLTAILASSVRAGLLDQAFLSAMAFRLDTLLCWGPRATSRSTTDLILCCNALLRAGLDVKSPLYQELLRGIARGFAKPDAFQA